METDQATRLKALLDDLADSRVSLQQAAADIRNMAFPRISRPTVSRQMAADNDMPPAPDDGSFSEVARAYFERRLTARQYEVLADAATQALRGV